MAWGAITTPLTGVHGISSSTEAPRFRVTRSCVVLAAIPTPSSETTQLSCSGLSAPVAPSTCCRYSR